jgi:hypothetical protein
VGPLSLLIVDLSDVEQLRALITKWTDDPRKGGYRWYAQQRLEYLLRQSNGD